MANGFKYRYARQLILEETYVKSWRYVVNARNIKIRMFLSDLDSHIILISFLKPTHTLCESNQIEKAVFVFTGSKAVVDKSAKYFFQALKLFFS